MLNSWLCPGSSDGHHVFTWSGSSARPDYRPSGYCQCGQFYYDANEKRITMIFTGYNPYTPSRSTPPTAGDLPDVPLYVSEAAQSVNATHSSADGKTAYDERKYSVWYCKWDNETKRFGSWYRIMDDSGLPADAVRIP